MVRTDIEPDILLLCTRVTKSTKEEKANLRRLLQHLKNTLNDKRIMGAYSLIQLCTWVDAAYGVHPNLKIHNGGCMSFGYGIPHCKSRKQKLNKKSSTETKVVGVSDYLTYNIWIYLFMGSQGYDIKQNILFQDNQSAINMEKNGKKIFTGNYRNIDIDFSFLRTGLNATKHQQHTTAQNTCQQIFL